VATRARVSRPIRRHSERTAFLRLPRQDWAAITQGVKTEFRSPGGPGVPPLSLLKPPTPVVVYSPPSRFGGVELYRALMVLESCRKEPLGAISAESLEAEGFESLQEFRRYWKRRFDRTRRRPWDPTRPISVFCLRPWLPVTDADRFARQLLERLYLDPLEDAE
jgi:hypothetical protein